MKGSAPEQTHHMGAIRHGVIWLFANERAISVANSYFEPSDPLVSEFLPRIVLAVLDKAKVMDGFRWDITHDEWVKAESAKS